MKIGIINIPTSVGPDSWADCFSLMAERAPVFGINEVFHPKAKALYRDLATQLKLASFGLRRGPNPIFWQRERYEKVEGERHLLHVRGQGVLARLYPGFNDARYATELVLRDRGTKQEFVVICTHWVPNGSKVAEAWRKWARREAKRGVRKLVKRHLRAGRPVWFIADTNIKDAFGFGKGFQWIRGAGIDKVGLWLPKGMSAKDLDANLFPAPTDHHHGVVGNAVIRTS